MRVIEISLCLSTLLRNAAAAAAAAAGPARFFAESGGLAPGFVSTMPSLFNLSDSQSPLIDGDYANSWWSSSFIHGHNDREYLLLSHVLLSTTFGAYRASLLEITNTSNYNQFTTMFNSSSFMTNDSTFDFSFDDFYMGADSSDPLNTITTWSTNDAVKFNLTYHLSAPVILNGGAGSFAWENQIVVNEWSMPAGFTSGSIEVSDEVVAIDPIRSLTWYDRQWQVGSASNWTWFELHLDSTYGFSGTKMSIWFYPSGFGTTKAFATVRDEVAVQKVMPAVLTPLDRTWTSPRSNWTYELEWIVELQNGMRLNINTTRDDQELADASKALVTYEGYVNVVGTTQSGKPITGFGLVEVQPIQGR